MSTIKKNHILIIGYQFILIFIVCLPNIFYWCLLCLVCFHRYYIMASIFLLHIIYLNHLHDWGVLIIKVAFYERLANPQFLLPILPLVPAWLTLSERKGLMIVAAVGSLCKLSLSSWWYCEVNSVQLHIPMNLRGLFCIYWTIMQ